MAMMDTNLDGRIGSLFGRFSARQAMFLSGSVLAAGFIGMAAPDIVQSVHDGFTTALAHVPGMRTSQALHDYFEGGKYWLSSAGIGLSDWIEGAGGELGHRAANTVSQMRDHLGDKVSCAKAFFEDSISTSAEFLGAWRASVRNSLLADPEKLVETAKSVLTGIVEVWGLYKGIAEIYDWAASKLSRKEPVSTAAEKDSAPPPVSIGHVENLHLNLAISGKGDVDEVVAKFASTLREGAPAKAMSIDAKKDCGRRLERPAMREDDVAINGERVVWLSENFNASLKRGMMGMLAKNADNLLTRSEIRRATNRFVPVEGIRGGIVYGARQKTVENYECGFAKKEHQMEYGQSYEM